MNLRHLLGLTILVTTFGGALAQDKELPQLSVTKIKVGESYKTDRGKREGTVSGNTWAKIVQVIDDDNMLIGIDNGGGDPGGNPRYSVVVWCKFSTKGLTDGETAFLRKFIGTEYVSVSGTTRYKTASGSTRTVFVLEPLAKEKK